MRITVLVDNRPSADGSLPGEAGFSAWVEHKGRTLLFDTGIGSLFLENARRLGLSMDEPEAVILSHGHYDHGGGLGNFFRERRSPADFYYHAKALIPKFSRQGETRRFQGIPLREEELSQFPLRKRALDQETTSLGDGLYLESGFPRVFPGEVIPERFVRSAPGGEEGDPFEDELVLAIEDGEGIGILTGCSHPGILNIAKAVQARHRLPLTCLIGGWHLKEAGEERIRTTLKQLEDWGVQQVGGCHCTGEKARGMMAQHFGGRTLDIRSGWQGECL